MVWNGDKVGKITFFQGTMLNPADNFFFFSCCSIWDEQCSHWAELYISLVFEDIRKELVVPLHSESFKAYEPVGEDSKSKK